MPQIVLHAPDLDKTTNKNQTRNLGLQSIVARENQEVAEMITVAYMADTSKTQKYATIQKEAKDQM